MLNNQDVHKVRTACLIYLKNNKEATAKQLLNYINGIKVPMKNSGLSSQAISRVLHDSSASWKFYSIKNNRGKNVWRIKGDDI